MRLRLALTVCFACAADWLLYGVAPGVGLTIWTLSLGLTVGVFYSGKLSRAGIWPVLWLLLALGTAFDESRIGRALLLVLGWAILACILLSEPPALLTALLRGTVGGIRSLTRAPSDLRRSALLQEHLLRRARQHQFPWWVYALPLTLTVLFGILIVPANLILTQWIGDAAAWVGRSLEFLSANRVLFWIVTALFVYGVLRFKLGRRNTTKYISVGPAFTDGSQLQNELRACLLTLAALNVLYLIANVADILYLWLSFELPAQLSYSAYAHHGSYRLIAAVVLAAITITIFFRLNTLQTRHPLARVLAFLFVGQNLFVLLGAARRLLLYVEVYGLTQFRVATFLWLLLVCVGFILLWLKLQRHRPVLWLFQTNAISTIVLLSAVALANIDGFIADWNVASYHTGKLKGIDIAYLEELDAGVIPALQRLTVDTRSEAVVAAQARAALQRKLAEASAINSVWQSWTWRRAAAISVARRE